MKKKVEDFVNQFKKHTYYSGPEGEDDLSKNSDEQLRKLQRENEAMKGDVRKLAFEKFRTRRSIRKYSTKKVDWKLIYEICCAALNSPVAGGVENTDIIVVQDKKKRNEIGKIENQQFWLADAPYLLVCVRDNARLCELYPSHGELYAIQNTAAVVENVLMMAHFYDLGACWVESCDSEILKEALGIPQSKFVDAVIPIGFPQESPQVSRCHESARMHFEKYGERKRPTLL